MVNPSYERYQRIWQTVGKIPSGNVSTYGEIATRAGLPGRARLVGTALKNVPDGLKIPWHRVVNARGELSFPHGSDGYLRQRSKLNDEGVEFHHHRIDLKKFGWRQDVVTLDELLWKPTD